MTTVTPPDELATRQVQVEPSHDPRTGTVRGQVPTSSADQVAGAVARAAACAAEVGRSAPAVRARWLRSVADALATEATAAELVALADAETALGPSRLASELARTVDQLRFYADVAVEGSWLGATIDTATSERSSLARVRIPLGPVAVFGASNFPFAFGVLGNDTASALAAGCPVVVKAHPAHPELAARLVEVAVRALASAGAPAGALGIVAGFHSGTTLVQAAEITAVAFTGSQRGGLALWRAANERPVVIPVFAEMGTVNPVVLTQAGARERMADVAGGFVQSFTAGSGQFCTKPGLLLAPAGSGAAEAVAVALETERPRGWHLTEGIALDASAGVINLIEAGAELVTRITNPERGWAASAALLRVEASRLVRGSRLLEECFGPVALVAEYADDAELDSVLTALQGSLAASVMSAGAGDAETAGLVQRLSLVAGRVTVDEWPTGVAWTWAQQHGGPWPATSAPGATSVGAAALDRFTRPITYQNACDHDLPPALQDANPWRLPRRVDGVLGRPVSAGL
ncbi:MAG TPA: aldehyde dehydrogenase family protein [Intrasporangium sp.]|jgi:NAD-dependent aldehyde dehydrogenases|uniref:aldehyde dehydrogenase family protein n=1 Tax=Intrasporangium sp. TaxID=1925024 RepID=UPI002F934F81